MTAREWAIGAMALGTVLLCAYAWACWKERP